MAADQLAPRPDSDAAAARRAAVEQAVSTLVYLAVMFGASYAVLKREAVARAWQRLRTRPLPASEAAARRAAADLARDLSAIEHGAAPPPRRARGLYERGQL